MLRKFYLFNPRTHSEPMVAALGYFNTKAFEDACQRKKVPCIVIGELAALTLLQRGNGIGVGVYATDSAIDAPECLKRQKAASNRKAVVDLTGVLVVEPPIKLEPIRQLLLA